MQKRLIQTAVLVLVLFLPALALAEGVDGASFFTWDSIGTFTGAVALVVFLVQVLKLPMDKVWRIPTQYVVYIISLIVLLLAQAFVPSLGGLTVQSGILCVFNAALVALAAMSTYDITIGKVEERKLTGRLNGDGMPEVEGDAEPDGPGG